MKESLHACSVLNITTSFSVELALTNYSPYCTLTPKGMQFCDNTAATNATTINRFFIDYLNDYSCWLKKLQSDQPTLGFSFFTTSLG